MKLAVLQPLPPSLEAACDDLRRRGLTVTPLEDALDLGRLAREFDGLVFGAAEWSELVQRVRQFADSATLPIAVWDGGDAGRGALEAGADLWLAASEEPADIALRLLALARRAHLGGTPRLDPLTGLVAQRGFRDALRHEFDRAQRYRRALALCVLEPDGLEDVNRVRGRDAGDEMLRHLATQLRGLVRDVDLLARIAGKRFAVLLPETDAGGGLVAAERLRVALDVPPAPAPSARTASRAATAASFPGAVSIGIAGFPARTLESADDLLGRALESLVHARRDGGNRVVAFGAPEIIWSRTAPDPSQI